MTLSAGYQKYIKSDAWFRKRDRWMEMAGYECEWCSAFTKALHVHHLNYDNFMHEKDEDVIVICSACHKHADIIRKLIKGFENEPLIQKILKNRGYPHNMKLNSRSHVIKLKRDLKNAIETIEEIKQLKETDKKGLFKALREATGW